MDRNQPITTYRPGPILQKVDNAIQQINDYPLVPNTCPLDSELSGR